LAAADDRGYSKTTARANLRPLEHRSMTCAQSGHSVR